jgi:hypothetical protein
MGKIRLKVTKHAGDKMMWLGITKEQVIKSITQGAKFKQTDGYLAKWTYVSVAYKKLGEKYYKIRTVFVD